MLSSLAVLFLDAGVLGRAVPDPAKRQSPQGTVTVNLAAPQGTPSYFASNFLYGIPDTANQIPDHFYTDMKFNYGRVGGSQLSAPARGWVYGADEYENRFASALANYKTILKHNGVTQLILSDLWGADGTAKVAMPGDSGNWTSYDNFLTAVINDINKNSMTKNLDIELWNEPDLNDVYWQSTQAQYLQMWGRGYTRMRQAFPNNKIVGPSFSEQPTSNSNWFNAFYSFIASNSSIPDQYTWHLEGNPSNVNDDLQTNIPVHQALLSKYGLPARRININEYGTETEQVPGTSAWYISRFERYNVIGLRGNWASGLQLHDYFANLLGKPNAGTSSYSATQAGYWGNGEYNVYKYYGTNMTGNRLATTGSEDRLFDIYATAGTTPTSLKMLCGSRNADGTWEVEVHNMTSLGFPTSGTVTIQTYHFDFTGGEFGNVDSPSNEGTYPHTYSNNILSFPVGGTSQRAFAFEIASYSS